MIHVECHMLDMKTYLPTSTLIKVFTNKHDFAEFYKQMSQENNALMNITFYDPQENSRKKSKYDIQLYSMSREIII